MEEARVSIPLTAPDERRQRRLVLVLVLLLGLTGGLLLARLLPTSAADPATSSGQPAPAASTTSAPAGTSPSSSPPSSTSPSVDLCDRVDPLLRPFFAIEINGEKHHPELTRRHRDLGGNMTGCRWEVTGSESVSMVIGPAPITRPWAVIDNGWTDSAPWGCHKAGKGRCTSFMWGAGTGAARTVSWASGDGQRQCVIKALGLELDYPTDDHRLWEVCARLIGKDASQ